MRQLVAGNWKMNGLADAAESLAAAVAAGAAGLPCDLLVCPPHTVLAAVARHLRGHAVAVGGQDCHVKDNGAHTGDVSAAMLRDAGATHAILGHSERRRDHGETDAAVRAKVEAALGAGLVPLVCVGESLDQRDRGEDVATVDAQLAGSLPDNFRGVVAYEPVWAIGTGRTPTEAQVAAMHGAIRQALRDRFGAPGGAFRILYGGSVTPANAAALLGVPEVGGALVGGASLKAADFLGIARAARALPLADGAG